MRGGVRVRVRSVSASRVRRLELVELSCTCLIYGRGALTGMWACKQAVYVGSRKREAAMWYTAFYAYVTHIVREKNGSCLALPQPRSGPSGLKSALDYASSPCELCAAAHTLRIPGHQRIDRDHDGPLREPTPSVSGPHRIASCTHGGVCRPIARTRSRIAAYSPKVRDQDSVHAPTFKHWTSC